MGWKNNKPLPHKGAKPVIDRLEVKRRNSKNSLVTETPPGGNTDAPEGHDSIAAGFLSLARGR